MLLKDMEKTKERLGASKVKWTLMGSTANWPESDIHWWYLKGTQHQFHTYCPACGSTQIMDEVFPACVGYDEVEKDYRYRCVAEGCGGWIDDPGTSPLRFAKEGAERLYDEYYRLLARAARTGVFDVLAHFDLPKKFGHRPEKPRADAERHEAARVQTARLVADAEAHADAIVRVFDRYGPAPSPEPEPATDWLRDLLVRHPEAAAILMKLQGATTPRPMTHDLISEMINELDAQCTRVSVTELKDNTFYASITLRVNGQEIEIDSRPSDALAVAVIGWAQADGLTSLWCLWAAVVSVLIYVQFAAWRAAPARRTNGRCAPRSPWRPPWR